MRTFVRFRQLLTTNEDLRRKIEEMEKRYDAKFQIVFEAIKRMLETPVQTKPAIGFHAQPVRRRSRPSVALARRK
jgi:cell division septum initiation protein DivIVA